MPTTKTGFADGVLVKDSTTGAAAIAASYTTANAARLIGVSVKFSIAPTTGQSITVTLNANAGAAYDILLYTLDVAAGSTTTILWAPEKETWLEPGDAIDVAYTNSDTRTYGVQITVVERY